MRTLTCGTVAEVEAVLALVDTATTEEG
jgi:hypothetical protein